MPIPLKKGKLFMKDGEGNFVQIVPESTYATPEYIGATATSAGVAGMVPAALSSQKDKYLKGDGTWAELVLPDTYQGATDELNGIAGLVPSALSEDKDKFLRGDGTWTEVDVSSAVHIEGAETIAGPKTFTQGPFSNVVKATISGTYAVNASFGQMFLLDVTGNTELSFEGFPANTGASIKLFINNKGTYTITWPSRVIWASAVPTQTSNKMDVYEVSTIDGGKSFYATRIIAGITKFTGDTMYIVDKPGCSISINGCSDNSCGSAGDPEIDFQWSTSTTNIKTNQDYTFSDIFVHDEPLYNTLYGMSSEITYRDEDDNKWTLTFASNLIPGFESSEYGSYASPDAWGTAQELGLENTYLWNYIECGYDLDFYETGDSKTYYYNCLVDSNGNRSYYSNRDVSMTITYLGNTRYSVTFRWTR